MSEIPAENRIEARLSALEEAVHRIQIRNAGVELEKTWETSSTRKVSIVVLTYLLMALLFFMFGEKHFLFNALIPTLGYFLSTQSLRILKKYWLRRRTSGKVLDGR